MPRATRIVVALTFAGGIAALVLAGLYAPSSGPFGTGGLTSSQWIAVIGVGALMAANWVRPVVVYIGNRIDTFQMDEGFFVILALLVPPLITLLTLSIAATVAQILRRRHLAKSLFNVGEVLIAAGLGLAVSRALAPPTGSVTLAQAGAILLGAVAYFAVNKVLMGLVMVSLGTSWTPVGVSVEVPLATGGVVVAIVVAAAIQAHPWAAAAALPVLVFHLMLVSSRFNAQHDRARMKGLFDVALDATNQRLRSEQVLESIVASARSLLRSPEAVVTDQPPEDAMAARLDIGGNEQWLVVAGRRREEPFDEADRMLLEAVAAIGKGALTNAELYGQVRYEQKRLSSITLNIGEGVCAVDAAGHLTFVNPAAAEMIDIPSLAVSIDDGIGSEALLAPAFLLGPAREAMRTTGVVREDDARFIGRAGKTIPVEYTASAVRDRGEAVGAVIAFRDITERKALAKELERHAFYDSLTGLANRRLLVDRLDGAVNRSALDKRVHGLIFVDVDRFKAVNDSLGHGTGNDLLQEVARRMDHTVGQRGLVARFGGDEFVVLLEGVTGLDEVVSTARRICTAVEQPLVLPGGFEIVTSVSVGIALTELGKSADDALRNADVAMYDAKVKGRGGSYQVFDAATMGPRSTKRLELETALRRGIERSELEVHYQPFFSLGDSRIVGAEALVRWRHPVEGMLPPAQFIEMAEETGLILPLGRFVLEQACAQAKSIKDKLGVSVPISVNLSPRQFQHGGLLAEVASVLDSAGLESEAITFEITETMVMEDLASAREVMKKLNRLGVRLAIDDFGTGQSSLRYLKQFPIHEVKVDRSFVIGVATDPVDSAIVEAVVTLAAAMGIEVVAEGVETPEQVEHLRSLGCDICQGYYFSRPLPSAKFEELISSRRPPEPTRALKLHKPARRVG
ncbi:MAG TPA: EAL domain-containing protein [Acidimicrobiales bacterium]|nr:EAL domain-containing protein [Acidimicrobiales bacterium]